MEQHIDEFLKKDIMDTTVIAAAAAPDTRPFPVR
jgi:hypothetical protein